MEKFLPLPGFTSYLIGDSGTVVSTRTRNHRPIATRKRNAPYDWFVARGDDGGKRYWYLHRAVLTAHVGPCPLGMEALHVDGNRRHNALSNLRWASRAENIADVVRHGSNRGTNNGRSKLCESCVHAIKLLRSCGATVVAIGDAFGIAPTMVSRICSGKAWRHISPSC